MPRPSDLLIRLAKLLKSGTLASFVMTFAWPLFVRAQDDSTGSPAPAESTQSGTSAIAADLYQFPPTTPTELVKAALITQKLDRVGDSRAFLRKLIELQLSESELRNLRDDAGINAFIELRSDTRLRPESEQLLTAINAATRAKSYSAQELLDFIPQLATAGSVGEKAASEIISSGDAAIPALLAADVTTPAGKIADRILKTNAPALRHGLMHQLAESDAAQQARILNLLGTTGDSTLAMHLLRWQFSPNSDNAVTAVARDAIAELTKSSLAPASAADAVDVLLKAAEANLRQSGARFSPLEESDLIREITGRNRRTEALATATQLTSDAVAIDASNKRALQLAFIAECAAISPNVSAEPTAASQKSTAELLSALSVALELHPAAAIECLRALRAAPLDQASLANQTDVADAIKVLRQAMQSADVRIRMLTAALVTEKLPVDVSSLAIAQSLNSARRGAIKPEVVIVSSDDGQLRTLEMVFEDAGYAPAIAETGPDGFDLATAQMNCELFVLQAESPRWPIATTLANLRADVRTRHTPVVVLGDPRFAQRVSALAETYQGVWFIAEPAGTDSLLLKLAQKNIPPATLSTEDRSAIKFMLQK